MGGGLKGLGANSPGWRRRDSKPKPRVINAIESTAARYGSGSQAGYPSPQNKEAQRVGTDNLNLRSVDDTKKGKIGKFNRALVLHGIFAPGLSDF